MLPGGLVEPASLLVAGGRIEGVGRSPEVGETAGVEVVGRPDLLAVPGFVDLQVNGAAGHDFRTPPVDWAEVGPYLLSTGVTSLCPAVPSTAADYRAILAALAEGAAAPGMPRVLGAHLEGPFLNPEYAGAHDPDALRVPDLDWVEALLDDAALPVAIWTLAPELPGALEVVERLARRGVVASAGHTGATYDQVWEAWDRGLSMVTHLFNAMRGLHHREPGPVGAGFGIAGLFCGLVLDLVHVHEPVARLALDALGERAFAVTDAIAAAGGPPGEYPVGAVTVDTTSGAPRLADGTIAGSVLAMDEAFAHARVLVGVERAVGLCSTTPALALGQPDLGTLAPGSVADVVLLDADGTVREVYLEGRLAWP